MRPIKASATKLSKRRAYEVIQRARAGETLSPVELDSLLLYFAPAMPKKAKTAMEWLSKAAAVQDVRVYLEYIWVDDDGIGYATDGHVAHRAAVDLPTGYYCPKTLLPVDGVGNKYPDVNRVFPNPAESLVVALAPKLLDTYVTTEKVAAYGWQQVADGALYLANKRYIDNALNGTGNIVKLVKPKLDHNKRAVCTFTGSCEFGDWVVMGMAP